MRKVALFIDTGNLYHQTYRKYKKKVSYQKMLDFLKPIGDIQFLKAYGSINIDTVKKFMLQLKTLGFNLLFKEPERRAMHGITYNVTDTSIDLVVDVLSVEYDTIILGTGDKKFVPLVNKLIDTGHTVAIIGCNIQKELRKAATMTMEIPESLLENRDKDNGTKNNEQEDR